MISDLTIPFFWTNLKVAPGGRSTRFLSGKKQTPMSYRFERILEFTFSGRRGIETPIERDMRTGC